VPKKGHYSAKYKIAGGLIKLTKNIQLELGQIIAAKYDDFQLVRKAAYNRIRNVIFRKDKGIDYRELQKKKNKTDKEKEWLKEYVDSKLLGKIKELTKSEKLSHQEHGYIDEMFTQLKEAKEMEKRSEMILKKIIDEDEIFKFFIIKVKGLNVLSMARLLYYFGHCEKAKYPSSLWAYAGYTPTSKHTKGESSNFNTKCRVEMFKIGKNLIRSNFFVDVTKPDKKHPGRYRLVYDTEKARQLKLMKDNPEGDYSPKSLGHADNRALRKMVKKLLVDYYRVCKKLTGKEMSMPYVIEKMGHEHFDDILVLLEQGVEVI